MRYPNVRSVAPYGYGRFGAGIYKIPGPDIEIQPQSQTSEVELYVDFESVALTGTPQWQENILGTPTNISGEIANVYRLSNLTLGDSGRSFRCAWSDGVITNYSDWATVTVVAGVQYPATIGPSVAGIASGVITSELSYETVPGKIGYITGTVDSIEFKDYFLPETP